MVAFMGLILCVLLGLIPVQDVFSGFSHPATITVAVVLILSRGLANSGVALTCPVIENAIIESSLNSTIKIIYALQ